MARKHRPQFNQKLVSVIFVKPWDRSRNVYVYHPFQSSYCRNFFTVRVIIVSEARKHVAFFFPSINGCPPIRPVDNYTALHPDYVKKNGKIT